MDKSNGENTLASSVQNPTSSFEQAAQKARDLPQAPGVYLIKDAKGRVIYVGKAKNLRSRASSYFQKGAAEELRTATWVHEIADIDYLESESEVDAFARRITANQGRAAEVQQGAERRQELPLPSDHHARRLPARRVYARAEIEKRKTLWSLRRRWQPPRRHPGLAAHFQIPHVLA